MAHDPADKDAPPKLRELSLEEFPDAEEVPEGEEALRLRAQAHKARKTLERELGRDPRATLLKPLSDEAKLREMTKRYDFDRKRLDLVLLGLYFIPVLLKYTRALPFLQQQLIGQDREGFNVLGHLLASALGALAPHIWLAEIYTAGLLFLRMPLRVGAERFVVGFDGVEVPERLRPPPGVALARRFVRWSEIRRATVVRAPDLLIRIAGEDQRVFGELRWNLWERDKKVFHKLLCQFTAADHPLRVLVEQELGHEIHH